MLTPHSLTGLFLTVAVQSACAAITIQTVPVGFPGNAGQVQTQGTFGSVAYSYRLGAFEVTNQQYVSFLNAVAASDPFALYNSNMGNQSRGGITRSGASGSYTYSARVDMGDKPVNYVSYWDAARFANWMTKNQPTGPQGNGTTETGAYALGSLSEPDPVRQIPRSPGATWFIPSENEWYKAAYFNPSDSTYFAYPTRSNIAPLIATADAAGNVSNPGDNVANYLSGANWNGLRGNLTTVGSATAGSSYNTFDQGGNVYEWNERNSGSRIVRGGAWGESAVGMDAAVQTTVAPHFESDFLGFRVASKAAPFTVGDFDEDFDVDGADLERWRLGFGLSMGAAHGQGDSDGDSDVDGADFLLWQRQLESSSARGVPEPKGLTLIVGALAVSISSRRLRSQQG